VAETRGDPDDGISQPQPDPRLLSPGNALHHGSRCGDRDGFIVDPFGHGWAVASHLEDVTPDEMTRRAAELFG
jgi:hypothetical protein